MNTHDAIRALLATSHLVLTRYLSDLADEDLLVRPVPGANHIAWQLGHLITSEYMMIEGIKPGSSPVLPDEFIAASRRDMIAVDEAKSFFPKATYLSLYDAQRAATLAVLPSFSPSDLDAPGPEKMRAYAATVGDVFLTCGTHELMHAGQFAVVRRKLGKPITM